MYTTFTRPFKPVELAPTTVEAFHVQELASQLMTEKPFTEHGRNALTLVRSERLTMVLTVAKEGKTIPEHHPPGPTTIVVLSGSVTLMAAEQEQSIRLDSGTSAAFAPDVVHSVEAHEDSVFLILIGGKH